ncbi:MAG: ABC transporter permease [Eubacteriales bacterium]|nr:ABC transporter permease [Eubacteriales bacterium]
METKKNDYMNIPADRFEPAVRDEKIFDKKFESKPIGYFKDAMIRFAKNKSSLVAAFIIAILLLFAIIVPFFSKYSVDAKSKENDSAYAQVLPKSTLFAWAGWDGCKKDKKTQGGYDYLNSIGQEVYTLNDEGERVANEDALAVKKVYGSFIDELTGEKFYNVYVDSYAKVGFMFKDLSEAEYKALQAYQNETGIQVMYPIPATYKTNFSAVSSANVWYKLANEVETSTGEAAEHDEDGNPIYEANYRTKENKNAADYDSIRISDEPEADGKWAVYAVKNQSGYKVRVLYSEYYYYERYVESGNVKGFYPYHLFGTNQFGQDIFVCLASGARLSFILAFSVSAINFIIGIAYGSIEGYYGGAIDLILERVSDILSSVPFVVVATLFNLHLADRVGPLVSLLFAFVLTGWTGIAYRVRTQFYRFKGSEYVLAARTLGASDSRLIFRHILPNSLGTIITATILIIPGVIFSESMLSYLNIIDLQTSGMTSIGTMLSGGNALLSTYPHIIFFPALFIALLEISFNLFGNGLRDAFNPSLRGADE